MISSLFKSGVSNYFIRMAALMILLTSLLMPGYKAAHASPISSGIIEDGIAGEIKHVAITTAGQALRHDLPAHFIQCFRSSILFISSSGVYHDCQGSQSTDLPTPPTRAAGVG